MGMRVHELHAAAVHAPLVLLPTAAAVDMAAALSGSRGQGGLGRTLWWLGAGSGLFAGLAGMAASQEVRADEPGTSDMMWLHGMVNFGLVVGAFGIAGWRATHRPSVLVSTLGLAASAVSLYTAYLGGEMVYERGVGVRRLPADPVWGSVGGLRQGAADGTPVGGGVGHSPPLLSRAAPSTFLRDALRGLGWLFGRGRDAAVGRQPIHRDAFGVSDEPTVHHP